MLQKLRLGKNKLFIMGVFRVQLAGEKVTLATFDLQNASLAYY